MGDDLRGARQVRQTSFSKPLEALLKLVARLSRDAVLAAQVGEAFATHDAFHEFSTQIHW
jgi:hypothetical protein